MMEALHDNALFVGALPLFLFLAGSHLIAAWQNNAWPKWVLEERSLVRRGIGVLVLMLGFMALRNLPGWPFDWLKPLAG